MLTYIREHFHPLLRLRRLRWFRCLQRKVDFTVSIRNGRIRQKIYWLRDLGYLLLRERLEAQTVRCLEALIAGYRPELFLDVGANVGFYSWRVRNLDPKICVWLFEPDVCNQALLSETIASNRLKNVQLFSVAVSDKCGRIEFLVDSISGKTGSIIDQSQESGSLHNVYALERKICVSCVTLDSVSRDQQFSRILIKIDVEGAEDLVLSGARELIRNKRPVILLECFDLLKIKWIKECGYMITDLKEKGNYLLHPIELTGASAWAKMAINQ